VSSLYDDDPLMRAIATLPTVLPDEAAARELRARCRARLENPPPRMAPVSVEPATVGALCVMYAWQIVRIVAR
jgi:hypothetical protein